MKSRIQSIVIKNFKAFREFKLDLESRHLLVYGANGSGKSSLYWAIYTFLESARKREADVSKYFDSDHPQNLLNIHEQAEPTPRESEIAITFRNFDTATVMPYRITENGQEKGTDKKRGRRTQLIFSGLAFFGKMWRCHDALESVQPELVSM